MDIIRVFIYGETLNLLPAQLGITEWPPPETIDVHVPFEGVKTFTRRQCSMLTDADVADNPHLGRGAVYRLPEDTDDRT